MMTQPFDVDAELAPLAANGDDALDIHDEEAPLPRLDHNMRAVSCEDLVDFHKMASRHCGRWKHGSKMMRDVNKDFIAPCCEATGQPCTRRLFHLCGNRCKGWM